METEKTGLLPFPDVLVAKKPEGSVYKKPFHTDFYHHANSHQHPSQKHALLTKLITHAKTICDTRCLSNETWHSKNIQTESVECHSLQHSHKYKTEKNWRNRLIRVASLPFEQLTSYKISKLSGIFNIIICLWLCIGFGLVTGFTEHLQIVTTKKYSTLTNSSTQLLTMVHIMSSISSVSAR
jgi:hypothetical protein